MTPQAIVAIIMALTVMLALVLQTGPIRHLVMGEFNQPLGADSLDLWENILFAMIGALAGYIAGTEHKRGDD